MELHDALRELVTVHGRSIFDDASGFRGVLDDVLAEDQASTGDINLLVDAVRFDTLAPLVAMIDGGADAARAVEEAGLRLARNRGGADQAAASWASAVLGYAVGKVPEAVVQRYRSGRPASPELPPPTAPPVRPPVASPAAPPLPPTAWPQPAAPPPQQPQQPPQQYAVPSYQPPAAFSAPPAPRKSRAGVWIAAAVAGVVLVAGGVTAVVLAAGGDDGPSAKKDPTGSTSDDGPKVDVAPAAIDGRYNALSAKMTEGASGCKAEEPGAGQAEVVQCAISTGTLRLVTYADDGALTAARSTRLDYSAGTLTADNGATALYELDPERAGTSDPAVVYWDSKGSLQSATLTGASGAGVDDLVKHYTATVPRVSEPTSPADATLREFIAINMDVATCARQRTFFTGETEESKCESGVDGVAVNVGRFETRKDLREDRKYYKKKYDEAAKKGNGGTWRFGKGDAEGAYYAYVEDGTATLYWDWNKDDCNCYGIAWHFQGDLAKLEKWWPSDD
ncbi:hypothetical protein [Pimelobacter simplex]|uniref:hypothetical protein n=1 Tax=Nocardioides simplex TaxID=2045 RepID=UPI003AAD4DAB